MVPEEIFTGSYATNPFNFEDLDLWTIRVIREGNSVGGTPIDLGKSHVQIYSTTMRSLGFVQGGNFINMSNFRNNVNPVFTLTSDLHLGESGNRPELTGARLGVELKFEKITDKPIRVILIGERRSVLLIDRNGEIIKKFQVQWLTFLK